MLFGEYENGLELYEYRNKPMLICDAQIYNGEDTDGKTLLVYHEQGFGDTLNFARLLKHPKLQKTNIILSPQEPLIGLFKASSLDVIVMSQDEITAQKPHFDYHATLVGLLRTLQIRADEIPGNIEYIRINKQKADFFTSSLGDKKPKIGLAWSGNKNYTGNALRSIGATMFGMLKNDRFQFVSLQKEFLNEDMEFLKQELEIIDMSDELNDFLDTAALIHSLDVIVTVDTSVAHLAATMGKPTWILLPSSPDWRWGANDQLTPWYKSAKLYRKAFGEEWESVFESINMDLANI